MTESRSFRIGSYKSRPTVLYVDAMIDEGPAADLDDFRPGDPYDLDLPERWSAQYRDRTAVYENGRGDHRVRIVEFSKGLSLYWWVDVYVGDQEWHRQEVGLGDSYTDPEAAVEAVESYLAVVADPDTDAGGAGSRSVSAPPTDARYPGPDGWTLEDAVPAESSESDGGTGRRRQSDAE